MLRALVAVTVLFSACVATIPAAEPTENITFPQNQVKTLPAGSTLDLSKGQVYVVAHSKQLLIRQRPSVGSNASVTMSTKAGPITFPVEVVPGYSDPSGYVTFTQPFIYLLKAGTAGDLEIEVIPAINATEVDTKTKLLKQVPLQESDIQKKYIRVLGDLPPPGPGPGPTPEPNPNPKADKLLIIVVEDLNQRTLEQTLILADAEFWQAITNQGHKWKLYSKNATELVDRDVVSAIGLPTLIIKNQATGEVLIKQKLPLTKTDFNNLIKSVSK